MNEKKPKKSSTVRHTRAVQRDRRTQPTIAPSAPAIEARLAAVSHPATLAQVAACHERGLRQRLLPLPVMVAYALRLVWRQRGSVAAAVRVLAQEGRLWADPLAVSPQAGAQRLRCFPAALFARVLLDVRPVLHARWQTRQRAVPVVLARAQRHFGAVLALDGAPLDAVLHKVGRLRAAPPGVLAGRIAALLDVVTHLPRQVWYEADQRANDRRCWDRALAATPPGALLLFDGGFLNYAHHDEVTATDRWLLTRAGAKMAYRTERVLQATADRHDLLVQVGAHPPPRCAHPLRLIAARGKGQWRRYLPNVCDPQHRSGEDAVVLYAGRWRVEDAFLVVKRLLGLAYRWTGAVNGVLVQVWARWLRYAVLVDLTDAVAAALRVPFREVSLELASRGRYHFTQAYHRGAADDVVAYLAANAQLLGLLKRKRRAPPRPPGALTTDHDP